MHFWITSADGIYFRKANKYVLLDDKRQRATPFTLFNAKMVGEEA